jgi:hypothetical protein
VQAGHLREFETKSVAGELGSDWLMLFLYMWNCGCVIDKVIWLGFSNGYLESNQGYREDVPYCILVVFSTQIGNSQYLSSPARGTFQGE